MQIEMAQFDARGGAGDMARLEAALREVRRSLPLGMGETPMRCEALAEELRCGSPAYVAFIERLWERGLLWRL